MSCPSQFLQRKEVGDRAADAEGEQRQADHGAAGVGRQHRALEEAVLSLQGGERPAQEQGSPVLAAARGCQGILALCSLSAPESQGAAVLFDGSSQK